jgi:hypothetical protein
MWPHIQEAAVFYSALFVKISSNREGEEKQRLALSHVLDKVRSRHRHTMISLGLGNDDIESDMKNLRADSDPKYISESKTNKRRHYRTHTCVSPAR